MANKLTKKDKYTLIKQVLDGNMLSTADKEMLVEFCDSEIDLLNRKTSRVDTKKVARHESIMDAIKIILFRKGAPMRCSDIAKEVSVELGEEISLNLTSSILRKMLSPTDSNPNGTGEVIKTMDKKVAYFSLA